MARCLLGHCCFCIDLRTGCLIIGYINLVVDLLLIVAAVLLLLGGGGLSVAAGPRLREASAGMAIVALAVLALLLSALLLGFTIALLVGLHQHKRGHVKAYLVYACIFIVISIILFFAGFAVPSSAGGIAQNLIYIALNIYWVVVIRSYYYKMDDKRPAVYSAAA